MKIIEIRIKPVDRGWIVEHDYRSQYTNDKVITDIDIYEDETEFLQRIKELANEG